VPRIRLHDLRHTHATLLLADGLPAKVVQERLGHTSISTTLDLYGHVTAELEQQAADRIASILDVG
jgi:integrase